MKQNELRKYIKANDVMCDRCNKNKAVIVVNKKCICEKCYREHSRIKNRMIMNYFIGIFISSVICNALGINSILIMFVGIILGTVLNILLIKK